MLQNVALALLVGLFTATGMLAACGAPTLAQCRLEAVSALPLDDPDSLDVRSVRQLATALKACSVTGVDGGL